MIDAQGSTAEARGALVANPSQPVGVAWPVADWPRAGCTLPAPVESLVEEAFDTGGELRHTYALVLVVGGRLQVARYAGEVPAWEGPGTPVTHSTALLSWSMAKSVLHVVVGMLVGDGLLDLEAPAPVAAWQGGGDPRAAITLRQLLEIRDGLQWSEDYVDAGSSDVIEMLFGAGASDVAAYAAARPLAAAPGTLFRYSSGTSNLVASVVGAALGGGENVERYVTERLFGPLGMTTARLGLDPARTWVASSYLYASAEDYARFGLLCLRGGVFAGTRLVAPDWLDFGRTPRSVDPGDGALYGAHWWVVGDRFGSFRASGYEGQSILVCPGIDLVLVRLGRTPAERYPALDRWRQAMVAAVAGSELAGTAGA